MPLPIHNTIRECSHNNFGTLEIPVAEGTPKCRVGSPQLVENPIRDVWEEPSKACWSGTEVWAVANSQEIAPLVINASNGWISVDLFMHQWL